MTTQAKAGAAGSTSRAKPKAVEIGNGRLIGDAALVLVFAATAYWALTYPPLAKIFPLAIGLLGMLMSLANLGLDVRRRLSAGREVGKVGKAEKVETEEEFDPENSGPATPNEVRACAWIAGYSLFIWVLGFEVATAVYMFAILKFEARGSYMLAAISAAVTVACVVAFSRTFDVHFPVPLLPLF